MDLQELINSISEEFVGVWKFRLADENPVDHKWCASIIVGNRLIDTKSFRTITEAICEARKIVVRFRNNARSII